MAASDHLGVQFHSTYREGAFPSADWLHVGTRAAATNRATDWAEHMKSQGQEPGRATMHSVTIAPGHDPWHITDAQANEVERSGLSPAATPISGHKVYSYTNEFEDPGSTSYLVHRSAIQHLGSEAL